jgi:hypothetical protein
MESFTAIMLKLRSNSDVANQLNMSHFITRGPKQRKPCWSTSDNIAMIDTAVRQWKCAPIYIIQNIETKVDEVFDGAHRCEALLDFIDNKFILEKTTSVDWKTSPLKDYINKKFSDLPPNIQKIIKEYKFDINIIDETTANDPEALKILWTRLSKAGKPLNNFETTIPIHSILHKDILEPNLKVWYNTSFFSQEESKRGQLEVKLHRLLALSEKEILPPFASMEDLIKKWSNETLGITTDEINRNSKEQIEPLNIRLKNINNLFKELEDRNTLRNKDGKTLIDKSNEGPLMIILGRLGYWFSNIAKFRRYENDVCKIIKDIIQMNPNDLCKLLVVNSRNATYQKKLISYIDTHFKNILENNNDKRLFTMSEKQKKLEEQQFKCSICSELILEHQRFEGDHIVEYSRGGLTTFENLQIVHKHCHIGKNMTLKSK